MPSPVCGVPRGKTLFGLSHFSDNTINLRKMTMAHYNWRNMSFSNQVKVMIFILWSEGLLMFFNVIVLIVLNGSRVTRKLSSPTMPKEVWH